MHIKISDIVCFDKVNNIISFNLDLSKCVGIRHTNYAEIFLNSVSLTQYSFISSDLFLKSPHYSRTDPQ